MKWRDFDPEKFIEGKEEDLFDGGQRSCGGEMHMERWVDSIEAENVCGGSERGDIYMFISGVVAVVIAEGRVVLYYLLTKWRKSVSLCMFLSKDLWRRREWNQKH